MLPSASEPRFIVAGVFDSEARQHVLAAFTEEAAREHCRERNEDETLREPLDAWLRARKELS